MIGCFIGLTVFLIGSMPYQIYDSPDYRTIDAPDGVFESVDIATFAETTTFMFNETGGIDLWFDATFYEMNVDLGNHDIDLYYRKAGSGGLEVRLYHYYFEFWGLIPNNHYMTFHDRNGIDRSSGAYNALSVNSIESNEDPLANGTSKFTARCDHTRYQVVFAYNHTDYNSFLDAWNSQELGVFFGVNFDQVGSSYSAFDLITGIMFYSLPNTNPYVNSIIAIPLWISFGYIAFILVLRAIGAVFGGGA